MNNISLVSDSDSSVALSARPSPEPASPLVLVVEDHDETRFLLRTLLERRSYRVIEAVDGEEAVRQAEVLTPDLILMDVSLPRVDGLSAMCRIREHDGLRRVPIIFLSGHVQPAAREAALAAGGDEYLTKPLDTGQLYRAIEKQLARVSRRRLFTLAETGASRLKGAAREQIGHTASEITRLD